MHKLAMAPHTDYLIFARVFELGSFSAAAEALFMTPSAVNRRVSRMEDRMGNVFFHRTTRKLTPTPVAEAFYIRCQKILAYIDHAEDEVVQYDGQIAGVLRIGVIAAFAPGYLIPLLPIFRQAHPNIIFELVPEHLEKDFNSDDVDIRIHSLDLSSPGSNEGLVLLEPNPWVICAAPSYLERFGRPVLPHELKHHDCLLIGNLDRPMRSWSFEVQGKIEHVPVSGPILAYGAALREAALLGMGVVRIASYLVREDVENGALEPLLQEFCIQTPRAIFAQADKEKIKTPKVRAFLEFLKAQDRFGSN